MRYHRFLRHSTYRRYGIFILTIFFSWYGIQAWVNLKSIDTSILQAQENYENLIEKTDYMEKFYNPYLDSEYAPYFLGHENGSLYRREYIVRLKHAVPDNEEPILPEIEKKESILLSTPQQSWNYFIDQKLPFLKERKFIQ